jgi:ATP-dependent DNA helicase RecG
MHRHEIIELISNGENSGVEFKEDSAENYRLAQEVCAFANLMGGVILFGVSDNGKVRGISNPRFNGPRKLEEWVMEVCRTKIDPPIIPYFEIVKEFEPGKDVAAIRVPQGPNKPYARIHDNKRTYFIRVGSTSSEAEKDELERLFQTSGHLRYGQKPVPGASILDLDFARLESYFKHVLRQKCPKLNFQKE